MDLFSFLDWFKKPFRWLMGWLRFLQDLRKTYDTPMLEMKARARNCINCQVPLKHIHTTVFPKDRIEVFHYECPTCMMRSQYTFEPR